MPDAAPLESFAAGVETAVDVAQVERQLTELWQMAAESESGAVTRASLFNLVAYTESEESRDRATAIISELTSRHPCRAIVLCARPDAARAGLIASITAHCHLAGGGGKQVCCEQISIAAAGAGVSQLPGAVLPLLEADLPTVLWWRGNFLTRAELFRRLVTVADRVIFDTSKWTTVPVAELADLVLGQRRCRFADLSWTRLAFWQRLTADFFDPPACRQELARLESVEIVHGNGPGARWRALLYGSWLGCRLDWSIDTMARRMQLHARPDREAGLLTICLKSAGGEFVIQKEPGQQTACNRVRLPHVCELPRRRALWPTDDVSLLSQELDHPGRHTVYERALALANQCCSAGKFSLECAARV